MLNFKLMKPKHKQLNLKPIIKKPKPNMLLNLMRTQFKQLNLMRTQFRVLNFKLDQFRVLNLMQM